MNDVQRLPRFCRSIFAKRLKDIERPLRSGTPRFISSHSPELPLQEGRQHFRTAGPLTLMSVEDTGKNILSLTDADSLRVLRSCEILSPLPLYHRLRECVSRGSGFFVSTGLACVSRGSG